MKLYLSPGACSLADHIALHEAGFDFERVKVDTKTKRTEDGRDYLTINPKGYVPALQFDDGQVLTENIAILSWIADQDPSLAPSGPMGRYRLLEMLAFISTEIHKSFKPFFKPDASEAEKAAAGEMIGKRLTHLAERLKDDYLFGGQASVADAYLFVMCLWAQKTAIALPDPLPAFVARMKARPAVRLALEHEGLAEPAAS
ncbi:glutathione transferase GstA [Phenylobacterium sp.]|uniref:glutathione transferase GstA n=1 Tax=Phenylobacterium sp. TaxID=1871053 RepID=UPI003566F512